MRKVIFLHRKFPNSERELYSLLIRWNEYGRLVADSNHDDGITVFCLSQPLNLDKSLPMNSNNGDLKFLKFKFGISSMIKETLVAKTNYTVVCGDNQLTLLLGLILRVLNRRHLKLQIQFHGNTYSYSANKGIVGKMRVLLSRLGIYFADSIRIVSRFQGNEIRSIYPSTTATFVLAPIPIDFSKIPGERLVPKYDVIVVGRLQDERGTTEMIRIVQDLLRFNPSAQIAIAGLGPDLKVIKKNLELDGHLTNVHLLGQLPSALLNELYSQSRVLLSCAPEEGYGLTIREAALSGIHVVARESRGAKEAYETYKDSLHLYSTPEQAVQHLINLIGSKFHLNQIKLHELQKVLDQNSMISLAKSWTQI